MFVKIPVECGLIFFSGFFVVAIVHEGSRRPLFFAVVVIECAVVAHKQSKFNGTLICNMMNTSLYPKVFAAA